MQKKNSTLTGLFWKFFERIGVAGVQFILQIILARLLTPEHYGALSIMIIFTALANVFVQQGFNTALIQNKDVQEEDYSSVLWVSLGIATVLYAVIYATSPMIARFYSMDEIVVPLRVLALMLFPGALNSIQIAKVSREMDFRKVFYGNIVGIVLSGFVGIIIAYMGGGLWALVAQTLLNVLVSCVVMHCIVDMKIRLVCNMQRIRVLFSYGWKLLVAALLDTLYQDLRSLVIGKKYNSDMLGYYNRGKQFPQFINNATNGAVQSVMLPAMAVYQDDSRKVKEIMRNAITLSAYVIFPVMAGVAAVAKPMVNLLLTDKWLPCVPFIQIYCFNFAFYPVHTCNLQAINAMGRSDMLLKLEWIKKSYGIVVLAVAVFCFDSPIMIAATGMVTTWIGWFVNAYPNKKLIHYAYKEQMMDLVPQMMMSLVMCAGVLCAGYALEAMGMADILIIVLQMIIGVALYIAMSVASRSKSFYLILSYCKKMMKK